MTQAFKNFTMDESHDAYPGNWCTAAQAPGIFGLPRTVDGITIHYAEGCPTAADAVGFFCNGPGSQTSAHYVAYAGYVACLVSPDNVAYACGNGAANCSTISIECDPSAPDNVYPVVAELVMYLRNLYQKELPLYPHNHWVSTQCPGPWDLNRLEALTHPTPTPAPSPNGGTVALSQTDLKAIYDYSLVRQGGQSGPTSLRGVVEWYDANNILTRQDIKAEIDSQISKVMAELEAIKALLPPKA